GRTVHRSQLRHRDGVRDAAGPAHGVARIADARRRASSRPRDRHDHRRRRRHRRRRGLGCTPSTTRGQDPTRLTPGRPPGQVGETMRTPLLTATCVVALAFSLAGCTVPAQVRPTTSASPAASAPEPEVTQDATPALITSYE